MAIVRDRYVSSSSSSSHFTYHVFLSFRGKDTRKTFTDHLYTALVGAGLSTFRDDDEMDRGENITSELETAISSSKSSIIVFSKDYASSTWCLDELVLILQRKVTSGLIVLPIFYDIDPSSIRRQTGCVSQAFDRHEEQFKMEADDREREYWMNKVKEWRTALTEVANLGGMVLQNEADGYESKFIQKVIRVIEDKVTSKVLNVAPCLIGMDARVENINLWLINGSTDVDIAAIYGMGGIGKTTIAKCVFNMNLGRFEYTSFLENIREMFGQPDGLIRLQRQLLSTILKRKERKIKNVNYGVNKIKDAICRGRVLLVLDDVDHASQLDVIFGMREWFHPGSKIIITTRHINLLKVHEACEMYAVEVMNFGESLRLFSWHAFGDNHPAESYVEQSNWIIMHCQGLPLALQVLGSSLRGKSVDVWRSAVEKLEVIPHCEIQNILKISYDSLQDDHDKNLFLEIACFFIGKNKSYVIGILDGCNYYATVGIENLIDRCLLTIDEYNKLRMHQLLQTMGREIIRQQSPMEPGKRSKLWHYKDSFQILKDGNGTETIEGLALNMNMLTENKSIMRSFNIDSANGANFKTDSFSRMHKLRLLELQYVKLTGGYKDFPKNLRWLCWRGFPLRSLPSQFPLQTLVAIDMRNSNMEQLWQGNQFLGLLKFLNISHCHHFIKTPNFTKLPALEKLILKDCARLVKIDESIGNTEGLMLLDLRDCKSLKKLPSSIGMLKFLEILLISGCSNLKIFPVEQMNKLESLKVFHADRIPMQSETLTTRKNTSWHEIIWSLVSRPKKCPQLPWTSLPPSLVSLSLVGCNLSENVFPRDFCKVASIEVLDLSCNPIRFLPDCFKRLRRLQILTLLYCVNLQALIEVPNVEKLVVSDCPLLEKVTFQSGFELKSTFFTFESEQKLELVENLDSEIINSLGIHDVEVLKNIQIKFHNSYLATETKGPIQGVYENFEDCQLFSIFFPGSSVPRWYDSRSTESFISFTVPSHHAARIRYLNICFVYKISREVLYSREFSIFFSNKTKDMKILYTPSCYGIPEAGEYMIWLSRWKFHNNDLAAGDELNISRYMIKETAFEVKEVGIDVMYDDDQVQAGSPANSGELIQQACSTSQYAISPQLRPLGQMGSERIYNVGCNWRIMEHVQKNL